MLAPRSDFIQQLRPGKRKLAVSLAAQVTGSAFNALVSFALLMFLARTLGTGGFGEYVALLGVATLALIAIEGGWPLLVYRESVITPGHDAARGALLARSSAAHLLLVGATLTLLAAVLMPRDGLAPALACMTAVAAMNLISALLRASGRFVTDSAWQVAGRLVSAAVITATVLWLGLTSPTALFAAWGAGLLAVLLFGARRRFPLPKWGGAASYAMTLPFIAVEGLSTVVFKSDVALLGALGTAPEPLSIYAACTRLNEAALLLFAPAANVMLKAARERVHDSEAFARYVACAMGVAAAAGAAAVITSAIAGELAVRTLFGSSYAAAGTLLPWTALALPFSLPSLVGMQALVARDGERRLVLCLALAAALLITGLTLGRATAGLSGAALGLAAAHAVLLAALLFSLSGSRRSA